ncbi:transposase [Streptomyces sp. G9]
MQWRDLPERSGPWKTVYKRHRPWSADETWERVLQQAQVAADAAGEIDWDIPVDSTIVRAPKRRRRPHQRGRNSRTPGRKAVAEPARPPGGGGGPGECLTARRLHHQSPFGRGLRPVHMSAGERSASHGAGPAGRAGSLGASRLTSRTATGPAASTCGTEASCTPAVAIWLRT